MRNWPLIGTLVGLILVLVIGTWHNCSPGAQKGANLQSEVLRSAIKTDKQVKANLKPIIIIQEKEVIKYVTKWKVLKDTIQIPAECDTVAKILISNCDSALNKQSNLIGSLNQQARIDSSIIQNQDKIIEGKNLEVLAAKKETRRQKRRTIIVTTLAVIIAGLAITK